MYKGYSYRMRRDVGMEEELVASLAHGEEKVANICSRIVATGLVGCFGCEAC